MFRKKNGATEDDVKSMLEGDVPKSKTGQCTNTCLMKQFKIVNQSEFPRFKQTMNVFHSIYFNRLRKMETNSKLTVTPS